MRMDSALSVEAVATRHDVRLSIRLKHSCWHQTACLHYREGEKGGQMLCEAHGDTALVTEWL